MLKIVNEDNHYDNDIIDVDNNYVNQVITKLDQMKGKYHVKSGCIPVVIELFVDGFRLKVNSKVSKGVLLNLL